ncbi:DUF2079 domain-containing protein [Actinospica durhamensis]|uniref:DUF2079 domain-containing protein n=1 Tax=Actinospica durhamensis TaxID=1508375 RepID=A0A941IU75_9ACTN|nr:DUF2079 domain-containing protein [Actinospica durhamensis]MBR7838692.1 DUF2079 domain-containing protein [Actinospica durhamensis]
MTATAMPRHPVSLSSSSSIRRTPAADVGRRSRRAHACVVGALTAGFAALYAAYLLTLHVTMRDGMMDVAEFDQAISGYAHFSAPHSPFVGLPTVGGSGALQLSDHFTPLLAVLAPLYWIHDGPETLLVGTAVLAALPIIPIWIFARRAFGPSRSATVAAYLIAFGYGLSWPLQMALAFEFHEVFLAMPVMAWMIERAQAGRARQAALISLLLLGVKDDMGFVVAVFGGYLATKDVSLRTLWSFVLTARESPVAALRVAMRADRRPFLAMIPLGLGAVALVNKVLLPAFGGSPTRNFTYGQFGNTPEHALIGMLTHPAVVALNLITPTTKLATLCMLLCPVLGLCLCSPITLLAVPLLLERLLSTNELYWGMSLHYNAFLAPILFCGGIDGAARVARASARRGDAPTGIRRRTVRSAPIILASWTALFGCLAPFPLSQMLSPTFGHTSSADTTAARAALAHVPSGTLVAAANNLGPQLLSRDRVIMWTYPHDRDYPEAPWVIADVQRPSRPFTSIAAQTADVRLLLTQHYKIVFEDDGYVVLRQE